MKEQNKITELAFTFTPVDKSELFLLESWFQNPEIKRKLDGMLPLNKWLNWVRTSDEQRAYIVYEENTPVGLVHLETYSNATASISFLVNPNKWSRGYGRRILSTLKFNHEIADIKAIEAYIEVDNLRSIKCFKAAGFIEQTSEVTEEGFIHLNKSFLS